MRRSGQLGAWDEKEDSLVWSSVTTAMGVYTNSRVLNRIQMCSSS